MHDYFLKIIDFTKNAMMGVMVPVEIAIGESINGIPQLTDLININPANLPNFYTIHGESGKSLACPFNL